MFFSNAIQLFLVILLLGVGIATVTDMQLNMLGSVLSLLAVITTCVAQIVSTGKSCFNLFTVVLVYMLWLLNFVSDDKHNPKAVQSFLNSAIVSILPLSINDLVYFWPLYWWFIDKSECFCFQVYTSSVGNLFLKTKLIYLIYLLMFCYFSRVNNSLLCFSGRFLLCYLASSQFLWTSVHFLWLEKLLLWPIKFLVILKHAWFWHLDMCSFVILLAGVIFLVFWLL